MLNLTGILFERNDRRHVQAAQLVGHNTTSTSIEAWVLSPDAHFDASGSGLDTRESPFIWLSTGANMTCEVLSGRLACSIPSIQAAGNHLKAFYATIEAFMPENATATLAVMSCCMMGAAYKVIVRKCGHVGVPFLLGRPGSCKTEALLCGLVLFGDYTFLLVRTDEANNHPCCSR